MESGAVQFGDDWPGLFLRGDDCMDLQIQLKVVIDYLVEHVSDEDKVKKGGIPLALAVARLRGVRETINTQVIQGGVDDGPGTTG